MRKILLLIISLMLPGCLTMKEAPINYFYIVDLPHGVCTKKKVTNRETLTMTTEAELPVSACDGIIGMQSKEFLDLRTYIRESGNK